MILDGLDVTVTGVFKTWKEAMPFIKKNLPDFMIVDLFLDNNEKGLDFIQEIKDYFIPIIVCTGYPESEYMNIALNSGVKAFISKPLDKPSLSYQIKKLIKELKKIDSANNFLMIKEKRSLIKVPLTEIYKLEIEGNYSYVYLNSNKRYVIKLSLKKMREQLGSELFIRCHRSTVVNKSYIQSIDFEENRINLKNGKHLDLGARYKSDVKKMFDS